MNKHDEKDTNSRAMVALVIVAVFVLIMSLGLDVQ